MGPAWSFAIFFHSDFGKLTQTKFTLLVLAKCPHLLVLFLGGLPPSGFWLDISLEDSRKPICHLFFEVTICVYMPVGLVAHT